MKIKRGFYEITGCDIGGVNPLPNFRLRGNNKEKYEESFPEHLREGLGQIRPSLPYLLQDRYTRERKKLSVKSLTLENEYLRVIVFPEYGGRIHSIFDKVTKRELLFTNPVIQPCNLAIRNAWLSGGIEWNFGTLGHSVTTCDNVFAAILNDNDGNEFIRIYEFERTKNGFWQLDLHLPEGSRHLICHVKLFNPFDKPTTTYWWTNIAVTDDFKTRVLASNKSVISYEGGLCRYDRLPEIRQMPGIDATYPCNALNAFDYFIQKDNDGESTWEAAAYKDGLVFYERSTAPLYYKKLFCWGAHKGGYRWQEFLSDGEGTGYYAEIQAGIAPSQMHEMLFPAKSKIEWTQCFGGTTLDKDSLHDPDYDRAVQYFDDYINSVITKEDLEALDKKYSVLANLPVNDTNLVHKGSGFGAVEVLRMKKDGDGTPPTSMLFAPHTIGEEEMPWVNLLENGYIAELNPDELPLSYMVSEKWRPYIESSLKTDKGNNWTALLHLGALTYESFDMTGYSIDVVSKDEDEKKADLAREIWQRGISLVPNIITYRNLAFLENRAGNYEDAERYYDLALGLDGALNDNALISEYLIFLVRRKRYEKLWSIYLSLPNKCKKFDRIKISAARAAIRLGKTEYLEKFFSEEHYDIREGEVSLTDIWFEFCAIKMAKERGIENPDRSTIEDLIDEAWDLYPPAKSIDFRMSDNKKNRYRISE
ncbi:MAG: DUF5107 domain-containing protein [Clostridia bacterium]|nr:DUF5107 domain-containing protein [Clostridia bacterium]